MPRGYLLASTVVEVTRNELATNTETVLVFARSRICQTCVNTCNVCKQSKSILGPIF